MEISERDIVVTSGSQDNHLAGITSPISSSSFANGSAPRQRSQQPSGLSPQEHPELFTAGPWPTLHHEPQRTIFEGRQSPGRSLEGESVSESASVQSNILVWYDQQVQRHQRLKQALRDAERHGRNLGGLYGLLTTMTSVSRWCQWSTPCCLPAPEACRPPPLPPAATAPLHPAEWTATDIQMLTEAYRAGSSIGVVLHLGVWFFVFLIVAIGLGVAGVGAAFIAILIVDIALFIGVIGLSCYSGHLRKHSEYQGVLREELPKNVPSILQLEIANRNANMMKTLLSSERRAGNGARASRTVATGPHQQKGSVGHHHDASVSEMRRAREEHEVDVEIAQALEAARHHHQHAAGGGRQGGGKPKKPHEVDHEIAATFTRLAAAAESGHQEDAVRVEAVDVEDAATDIYERNSQGFSPTGTEDHDHHRVYDGQL